MACRLLLFARNCLLPAALNALVVLLYSFNDPCNNNPGCMAGSATFYLYVLVCLPTAVALFLVTVFQMTRPQPARLRYFLINLGIAASPFVLLALLVSLGAVTR